MIRHVRLQVVTNEGGDICLPTCGRFVQTKTVPSERSCRLFGKLTPIPDRTLARLLPGSQEARGAGRHVKCIAEEDTSGSYVDPESLTPR